MVGDFRGCDFSMWRGFAAAIWLCLAVLLRLVCGDFAEAVIWFAF